MNNFRRKSFLCLFHFFAYLFTNFLCRCLLTVWVFIRQPVVAMEIKARVSSVALLLSWVAVDVLTLLGVAHLELLHGAHTGAPSVGWSGISIKHKTMQYNVLIS